MGAAVQTFVIKPVAVCAGIGIGLTVLCGAAYAKHSINSVAPKAGTGAPSVLSGEASARSNGGLQPVLSLAGSRAVRDDR